jgi:bifunctional non-homologous end joining protein LigD
MATLLSAQPGRSKGVPGYADVACNRKVRQKDCPSGAEKCAPMKNVPAVQIAGVGITHPDRVLYPEIGLTKRDFAEFYLGIADRLLPHLAGRPLALVRCPEGETGQCFYQKHPRDYMPSCIRRLEIEEQEGTGVYISTACLEGLIYLVQIGAMEFHPWAARADRLEYPDRLIFDLDPDPAVPWEQVVACAQQVHERLSALGLVSFLKTTGGKGLHVVTPLVRRRRWNEVRDFARAFAARMVADAPDCYTIELPKERRHGKIFLDYLRNARGAMTVAPYSTRAKPGAPVSTPVAWEELTPALRSQSFTVTNLPERLAALKKEPWEGFAEVRQALTEGMRRRV